MQKGRGGMGMHKHGISGRAPKSPRFLAMRKLMLDRESDIKNKTPKLKYEKVEDVFKKS